MSTTGVAMATSAATASPAASHRRLVIAASGTSPPSPLTPTVPKQYGIGTPVPVMSNPGTPTRDPDQREDGSAAATLSNLVRDLVEQLATANAKVLDLGTKCAALQKELEMHKEYQYQVVEHAVEKAKRDWDRHWQQLEEIEEQARRSVAPQPEAKPSPAPGFEAQQRGPEPAAPDFEAPQLGPPPTAQGIIFHPPKAAVEAEP